MYDFALRIAKVGNVPTLFTYETAHFSIHPCLMSVTTSLKGFSTVSSPDSSAVNTFFSILLHMAAYGFSPTSTDLAYFDPSSAAALGANTIALTLN